MKRALIKGKKICQILTAGQEFEVHPDFSYVDVPDDATTDDEYDNGTIIKPQPIDLAAEKERRASNLDLVLKAVVLAISKGDLVPAGNQTAAQIKSAIKKHL